jgi:Uma2 family endonuclease
MIVPRAFDRISVEEYLEAEQDADIRHEYIYGEIYAMAGASVHHNLVTGNIFFVFRNAAERSECRVYQSDMKVRVDEEVFYYPDVLVSCQAIADEYYENKPCVIVEVMSKSTVRKDTQEKRLAYAGIDSVQLYLLVDSRKRWVKSYRRIGNKWEERLHSESDAIDIPCIDARLTLEDIYKKTNLT